MTTEMIFAYFHHESAARSALSSLPLRYQRAALLKRDANGRTRVIASNRRLGFLGLVIGAGLSFFASLFLNLPLLYAFLLIIAGTALAGVISYLLLRITPNQTLLVKDETLLVITPWTSPTRERLVNDLKTRPGEHPSIFIMAPAVESAKISVATAFEHITPEQKVEDAVQLARQWAEARPATTSSCELLPTLKRMQKEMRNDIKSLKDASDFTHALSMSAEVLIDNAYVISANIIEVLTYFPASFYRQLPVVSDRNRTVPRIYAIAQRLVEQPAHTISLETISSYLHAFQQVSPLTIGELWAFPFMLRIQLIEQLHVLTKHEVWRKSIRADAAFWANRVLTTARRSPERLAEILQALQSEHQPLNAYFAHELFEQLYDHAEVAVATREWIERELHLTISELRQKIQVEEAAEQATISGAIRSLVSLSRSYWPDVVESLSQIDSILNKDPAQCYAKMDFSTRDAYRKQVEQLAKRSGRTESEVAELCVDLARNGQGPLQQHVGYYLIDQGRSQLQRQCRGTRFTLGLLGKSRFAWVYLIGLIAGTAALSVYYYLTAAQSYGPLASWALTALAIIPLSECVVEIYQWLLSRLMTPERLPKMAFARSGIPEDCKTLIVIPTLLNHDLSISDDLKRLEVHYLANPDANLKFSIFSDYRDTDSETADDDAPLIQKMKEGIQALNHKYGQGKFFLFHRKRVSCASEGRWIGWERKRGKLEQLNAFLLGQGDNAILYEGQRTDLQNIRYVITLDADTELPKDCAAKLVGTLAHPLNAPRLSTDQRLEHGYVIIQPRIETSLPSANASRFSQLFSSNVGTSPYQHLVSNIYQDVLDEGTYHGKGIYDVQAFHSLLLGRFPESHILSHDLLEGAFSRVGFASDIILLDAFPPNYLTFSQRQHRWIRGDWQIVDWLRRRVPTSQKGVWATNPLSSINRWKILDNLRRSLIPVTLLGLLVTSWFISAPIAQTSLTIVLLTFLLPVLSLFTWSGLTSIYGLYSLCKQLSAFLSRTLYRLAVLPYEAWITLDAIVRVFYRRLISGRLLLQWTTSSNHFHSRLKAFYRKMGWMSACAALLGLAVFAFHPAAGLSAIPFIAAWIIAPLIIQFYDRQEPSQLQRFSRFQKTLIRKWARLSWRFFDDFAIERWNWLPPDNFQEALRVEEAGRTSPTNIGLFLISLSAATRFGYLTIDSAAQRLGRAMETLKKLERFQGHFLNWYDLGTLKPLPPSYVSAVDSGNLLAAFWTAKVAVDQWKETALIGNHSLKGVLDTVYILAEFVKGAPRLSQPLLALEHLLEQKNLRTVDIIGVLRRGRTLCADLMEGAKLSNDKNIVYWSTILTKQIEEWNILCDRYFAWIDVLIAPDIPMHLMPQSLKTSRTQALTVSPTLTSLASGATVVPWAEAGQGLAPEVTAWLERLKSAFSQAQWFAGEVSEDLNRLEDAIELMSTEINMRFLYDTNQRLFAIGYNVTDRRMDNSFYDLLASEARLSSLVAIAKGDVPIEHWWALGRPYGAYDGQPVLLSWGGTMFEYLMPPLFTRNYDNSLLDQACRMAVRCQEDYGNARGIPWGISEAAYSRLDARHIYQYRAFGVPALGLRRGLEEDLVVSPYSTMLALSINPQAAFKNLHRLAKNGMLSNYGFFESVDYTRHMNTQGTRGVVTYAYMAHHVGMSLLAIDNVLHNNPVVNAFHTDPRICAIEYLLYEKPPGVGQPMLPSGKEQKPELLRAFYPRELRSEWNEVDTASPAVNLLSNGRYSVMITNSGGGYSRWKQLDLTRWRSDTTLDAYGTFCYLKDQAEPGFTSTTYQPTRHTSNSYAVHFTTDKAELHFKGTHFLITTEVVVDPAYPAEIRKMTVHNISDKTRAVTLTTYSELALAVHAADVGHPAFQKMFIKTEALPEACALIAHRRPRTENEVPVWIGFTIATQHASSPLLEWETNRERFIGRGRSLEHPAAMDGPLSGSVGFVLDPIFSLRHSLTLNPDERQELSLITVAASTREEVLKLIDIYRDYNATKHCIESAWTYAQLQLRHLHVHQPEFQLFHQLAGLLLYPHAELRPSQRLISQNQLCVRRLWAHGISGDLPILTLRVADAAHLSVVSQLLSAHAFLRARGLDCDLVILNDEATTYDAPLAHRLQQLIRSYPTPEGADTAAKGQVYLLAIDQLPPEELGLLFAVSNIVLLTSRGSLTQQLSSPRPAPTLPTALKTSGSSANATDVPLPAIKLKHWNGLGGFTHDDKEYVIELNGAQQTPAPWSNVLANANFGALVTESGTDAIWKTNSQTNRIAPWSNDPVCTPPGQVLYVRDDDSGAYWNVTPQPVREGSPYRIRHGQGYTCYEHNSHGLQQRLTLCVPPDPKSADPVLVQILSLTNSSPTKRHLSLFFYVEWVLGTQKENTQRHVQTEWNPELNCLVARNPQNFYYPNQLAFISSSVAPDSFSGDRTEFIGRNQSLRRPAALKRQQLSKSCGAGFDPCGALHLRVVLLPGESTTLTFVVGEADDMNHVRALLTKYQTVDAASNTLTATRNWWDTTLGRLQFTIPTGPDQPLINRWLVYQSISARMWGRTGFYQSSGAFGFRDQLQDSMAVVYFLPEVACEQLLRAARNQFPEGDVLHWWHPEGGGVRTRMSDDFLWLPLAVCHYVRITGHRDILNEPVSFLKARALEPHEHEIYITPEASDLSTSLLDHCQRALKRGMTAGAHGLPLMGGGDWNDGMNRVGQEGKGESIWLAWFTIFVFREFSELLDESPDLKTQCLEWADKLKQAVEQTSWDGNWYLRAYYDDGSPLGSHLNAEAKIDSISQSWATLSGAGAAGHSETALQSVKELLIREKERLSLLLTPPFAKDTPDPGYIKDYPPGIRENGGQYTHAAVWAAMAALRRWPAHEAMPLLQMINPMVRSHEEADRNVYRIEPYVLAGDIYSNPEMVGRGGWSWYTGASAWLYRAWLEEVFGFKLRGNQLTLNPKMPADWPEMSLTYVFGSTSYKITMRNPKASSSNQFSIDLDGEPVHSEFITLVDDKKPHNINIEKK